MWQFTRIQMTRLNVLFYVVKFLTLIRWTNIHKLYLLCAYAIKNYASVNIYMYNAAVITY